MKKTIGISGGIAIIIALIFSVDQDISGCEAAFPDTGLVSYSNVADWIDPTIKKYKKLSRKEGAPKFRVVWHHTATRLDLSASELCRITNDRFSLGCSYVASIHAGGEVIQVNDFNEITASVRLMNSRVISFAFVGNFENKEIPDIMLKAACKIKYSLEKYAELNPDFEIEGFYVHSDFVNTKCAGKVGSKQLRECGLVSN